MTTREFILVCPVCGWWNVISKATKQALEKYNFKSRNNNSRLSDMRKAVRYLNLIGYDIL